MFNKFKIKLAKNIEIAFLGFLILITVTLTTYYNYSKKKIYSNYSDTINNIYLKKTIDHILGKPLPYKQTNQVHAHIMVNKAFSVNTYPVLAHGS